MIQEYKEAFLRCYPHKTVEVKPRKVRGELRFSVVINGDRGDLLLTEEQVGEATRAFNRGK